MVTHRRANLIMLISNLPSVRSSRFKPNVGSRMILRLSLSFERIFLLRSSVTLCPSPFCQIRDRRPCVCVCMYSHQDDDDGDEHLFLHIFFFFSFLHIDIRFTSFTLRWKKKENKIHTGRTFTILAIKFMYSYSFSPFFAPVIFLSSPSKWLSRCMWEREKEIWKENIYNREKKKKKDFIGFLSLVMIHSLFSTDKLLIEKIFIRNQCFLF